MLRLLITQIFALGATKAVMDITFQLQTERNEMYTNSFDRVFELDVTFDGGLFMKDSLAVDIQYPSHIDSAVFRLTKERNTNHYFTGFNVDEEKAQFILKEGKNTNEPMIIAGSIFLKDGLNLVINTRKNHTYWMRETLWNESYHIDGIVISPPTDGENHRQDNKEIDNRHVIVDPSILIDSNQNNEDGIRQYAESQVSLDEAIVISPPTIAGPNQEFAELEDVEVTVDILIAYTEAAMVSRN